MDAYTYMFRKNGGSEDDKKPDLTELVTKLYARYLEVTGKPSKIDRIKRVAEKLKAKGDVIEYKILWNSRNEIAIADLNISDYVREKLEEIGEHINADLLAVMIYSDPVKDKYNDYCPGWRNELLSKYGYPIHVEEKENNNIIYIELYRDNDVVIYVVYTF